MTTWSEVIEAWEASEPTQQSYTLIPQLELLGGIVVAIGAICMVLQTVRHWRRGGGR